jgi:hypothetical protein
LSIAASLLRNEKRDDEDCMYTTYPFGVRCQLISDHADRSLEENRYNMNRQTNSNKSSAKTSI